LELQIKSLEAQISALKADLATQGEEEPKLSLADLYGILKGKASSSEEDIKAARYHFKWEGEIIY
jgi:hypothetical protein